RWSEPLQPVHPALSGLSLLPTLSPSCCSFLVIMTWISCTRNLLHPPLLLKILPLCVAWLLICLTSMTTQSVPNDVNVLKLFLMILICSSYLAFPWKASAFALILPWSS
ncbi:MAG: hypothetical protein ACRCYY_07325, partial [Trueperaceae bacterium]